jgi:hypothetical protein
VNISLFLFIHSFVRLFIYILICQGDALSPLRFNLASEYAIKTNTETLIEANEEVGLELHAEKTKYMLLSRHHSAGQNRDIKRANILSECGTVTIFRNDSNKSKLVPG